MAIYEGKDKEEKLKRDFKIVNNLEAGEVFKYSVQSLLKAQDLAELNNLIPAKKSSGNFELPFKAILPNNIDGYLVLNSRSIPNRSKVSYILPNPNDIPKRTVARLYDLDKA